MLHIYPQNCPFFSTISTPSNTPILDRPHLPLQTASIFSQQVFFTIHPPDRQTDRWARRRLCTDTCLRSIDCIATRLISLILQPIVVENLGVFSSSNLHFIVEVGRRIHPHSTDVREVMVLFQRISFAVQRFNSVLLQDTMIVNLGLPDS